MTINTSKSGKKQVGIFHEIVGKDLSAIDALMENTDAHLAYFDSNFNFVLVNSAYAKGCGYKKIELTGKNHFDLFPSKENQKIFEKVRKTGKLIRFNAKPFIFPNQPEKGITYWDWSLMPVKNENGEVAGFAFSLLNVTESKKREKRLTMQNALSKLLSEASSLDEIISQVLKIIGEGLGLQVGELWKVDNVKNALILNKTWYSKPLGKSLFAKMSLTTTFKKGEGLPGIVWKINKPYWIKNVLNNANFPRKRFAEKENLHGAFGFSIMINKEIFGIIDFIGYEIVNPNKELLELVSSISNQLGQFIEHKRSDKALKESEKKYHGLYDSITDGIVRTDMNGNILECNSSYANMLGYKNEEIKRLKYQDFTPKKWHKMEENIVKNIIVKKGYSGEYEKEYIKKDKVIFPVALKIWLNKNEEGKNIGMWGIVRDITEQKQLDKKKDEFINIVSHELKTPLTTLKAFSQILQKHLLNLKDEKGILYLSKINLQADKILSLVKDLLDVGKISEGKLALNLQLTNIDVLIDGVITDIQAISEKHKIIKIGKANSNIVIDRERISQVLINLLTNAIKYSPSSDKVICKIIKNKKEIVIGIKDFGIGILKTDLKKIFDRYMQIESKEKEFLPSLGLGLYISSEIIARHNGRIWVESKSGKGSMFYFTLPL